MSLTHITQGIKGFEGRAGVSPLPCPAPSAALPQGWSKGRLLSLVDEIAKEIGLTAGDLRILHRITRKTRAEDYESGVRTPICYERQADMAASIGVTPSYWRRVEARLHHLGLIRRDTGANGYRGGTDGPDGARAYAGLSLEPLIERLDEFVEIKEMQDAIAQKASWYRLEISTRRRRLGLIAEALGADHSFTKAYEAEKLHWKRPRDYSGLVALSEAHKRLEELIAIGESALREAPSPAPSQHDEQEAAEPAHNASNGTAPEYPTSSKDKTAKSNSRCSNSCGAAQQYVRHHIQETTDINKSICSSQPDGQDQNRTADKSAEDHVHSKASANASANCLRNKHREAERMRKGPNGRALGEVRRDHSQDQGGLDPYEIEQTQDNERAGDLGLDPTHSEQMGPVKTPSKPTSSDRYTPDADALRARMGQIAQKAGLNDQEPNEIKESCAEDGAGRSDVNPAVNHPDAGSWAAFERPEAVQCKDQNSAQGQGAQPDNKTGSVQSSDDFVEGLSLARMQALCSAQMAFYIDNIRAPGTQRRAYDFEEATLQRCQALGINPSALEEAIATMGWKAACLAVIIIDRNCEHPNPAYQIKAPGGALRAFTRKHQKGLLDLRASVFGIWGRG